MNKNDKDIDLRLALGSGNYILRARLNSSSGAGVNASSREDMPFAASDPLSELVWSPQNGLSLKCANNSSLADSKPFLTWNAGERTNENFTSENIKLSSGDNKVSCEEKLSVSQIMLDEAGSSGEKATVFRSPKPESSSSYGASAQKNLMNCDLGGSKCFVDKAITAEENHKGNAEENLCSSQNLHIADIAESSKINAELDKKSDTAENWEKFPSNSVRGRLFNLKGGLETDTSRSGIMRLAVPIRSEPPTAKVSEALVCFLPSLHAHNEIEDEVTSASTDVNKTKTDAPLSFAKEDSLHVDIAPTNCKICTYREKGKEKALSDGDIYGRSSSDKEDSHESVESCNSTRLFPKGVKRQNFDQGQLVESKRMRKRLQESPGSTSVLKANSSFMNWISNIVKGLAHSSKEDESSVLALTIAHSNKVCSYKTTDFVKPRTGFQNVFESLYNKTPISEVEKNKNQFIADSSELMVADEKSLENRNFDNPCKQVILSDEEMNPHISRIPIKPWIFSADFEKREKKALDIPECSRAIIEGRSSGLSCKEVDITSEKMNLGIPLPISCAPERSKPLSSLWITRLYTRNTPFEDCNRITKEALECNYELQGANHESLANDVFSIGEKTSKARDDSEGLMQTPKESVDLKFNHDQNFILPFQELRSSDATASNFAKRLDALRHIIHPLGRRDPPTFPLTCFFCGNSGHYLRKCPDLTETELENLLLNISSFKRVDDSSCLCIRCFQLDHWAISCPLASSQDHTQSKPKQASGSLPNFLTWNMKVSFSKRLSTSNEPQTSCLSNLGNYLKDKQIFPPCKLLDTQIAVPQEEVFHAIKKLRLSRTDILRWMDSDVSLSNLNGFFLRLRLGKLEGGLGGTGYYVACITGDPVENIRCKSKKSVLVDVGGMNSSVGSQFISNHDFLEEEIKGWWSRIVKSGGKIPCLDELKSKLETRECLGL